MTPPIDNQADREHDDAERGHADAERAHEERVVRIYELHAAFAEARDEFHKLQLKILWSGVMISMSLIIFISGVFWYQITVNMAQAATNAARNVQISTMNDKLDSIQLGMNDLVRMHLEGKGNGK